MVIDRELKLESIVQDDSQNKQNGKSHEINNVNSMCDPDFEDNLKSVAEGQKSMIDDIIEGIQTAGHAMVIIAIDCR